METAKRVRESIEKAKAECTPIEVACLEEERTEEKYFPAEVDYSKSEKINQSLESIEVISDAIIDPFLGSKHLPSGCIQFNKNNILGKGAFGRVYQGQWNKRPVALKEIDIELAQKRLNLSKEEVLEALQWEVSCLSTVSHPNLVQFYGLYLEEDENKNEKTYLVIEYCEGGDLKNVLSKANPNWPKLWQWALEITQGLAYLHHQGMLHRDLKAENILIDSNGRARLADLGVAQVDALLQKEEARVVFKGLQDRVFAAPEALQDAHLSTPETDIYALGLVFWQLVNQGKKPYTPRTSTGAIDVEALLTCMQTGKRETFPEDCPTEFKELILNCWAFEPSQRPKIEAILTCLNTLLLSYHPKAYWISLCQQMDALIHSKRIDGLNYIPSLVTEHRVQEDIDVYWRRFEAEQQREEQNENMNSAANPPLELQQIFKKFLASSQSSTLLLLGESGLGKTLSTYQLTDEIMKQWWEYLANSNQKRAPYFPIFIRPLLSGWSHSELKGGLEKAFKSLQVSFSKVELRKLRLLIIVDGYDECKINEEAVNLAKLLEIEDFSDIKMLVTCRPDTVEAKFLSERFALKGNLISRYFLPFNVDQLLKYLSQELHWNASIYKDYQEKFENSSSLRIVLRNPFVASLFAQSWKTIQKKDFYQLNRWQIFESFIEHWMDSRHLLLSPTIKKALIAKSKSHTILESLVESFNTFASEIAFQAFQRENILLKIQEEGIKELSKTSELWLNLSQYIRQDSEKQFEARQERLTKEGSRRALLTREDYTVIMQRRLQQFEADSPLKNKDLLCEFVHRNFFEYFVARRVVELRTEDESSIVKEALALLNTRHLHSEPEAMVFLAEGWKEEKTRNLIEPLFEVIKCSRQEEFKENRAPANAATILNVGKVPFSGRNLSNIQIPGADLHAGIFDETDFSGANLNEVNFQDSWLRNAILNKANLNKAQFGKPPLKLLNKTISSCCYSRDGEFLAIAAEKEIYVYLAKTFEIYHVFSSHDQKINVVTFGQNGWLVSGSEDGNIRIWDLKNKYLMHVLKLNKENSTNKLIVNNNGNIEELLTTEKQESFRTVNDASEEGRVNCIAISMDCKWLAAGDEGGIVWIWNVERQQLLHAFDAHKGGKKQVNHYFAPLGWSEEKEDEVKEKEDKFNLSNHLEDKFGVTAVAFDSGFLASAGKDGTVHIWHLPKESHNESEEKSFFKDLGMLGDKNGEGKIGLAWGVDGIFAYGGEEGLIRIFDMKQGRLVHIFEGHMDGGITNLIFGKDNLLVSSGKDASVRVWDITKKCLVQSFDNYNEQVNSITYHPDGWFASSSEGGFIRILDINQKNTLPSDTHKGDVNDITVFGSKGWVVSGSWDHTARIWDIEHNKLVFMANDVGNGVTSVASLSDAEGKNYVALGGADGAIMLWDVKNRTLLHRFKDGFGQIGALAFGSQGLLAAGGGDGKVRLWDIKQKQVLHVFKEHSSVVIGIFFTENGLLASCSFDGTIQVWDIKQKSRIQSFHTASGWFRTVAIGLNDWLAAGSNHGNVYIFDIKQKDPIHIIPKLDERDDVYRVAFGPNEWLAIVGENAEGGFLRIWDFKQQQYIVTLSQLTKTVTSVAWIQNQQEEIFLVTGSCDKAVRCWRITSGKQGSRIHLYWANQPEVLNTLGVSWEGAIGLDAKNTLIFKDRNSLRKSSTEKLDLIIPQQIFNINQTINGKSLLMIAVLNNQSDIIHYLIQQKVDLNQQEQDSGMTALMLAVKKEYIDICKLLMDAGADLTVENKISETPAILAVKQGNKELVELILKYSTNAGQKLDNGLILLKLAIKLENNTIAKLLIDEGVDTKTFFDNRYSLLSLATVKGLIEVVEYMHEKIPQLFESDSLILSLFGILNKEVKNLDRLGNYFAKFIKNKAYQEPRTGKTFLISVVQIGELSLIEMFCNKEILELKDNQGGTALLYATAYNDPLMLSYLLQNGADVNVIHEDSGDNALTILSQNGFLPSIKVIVEKFNSNLNYQDKGGFTAIHSAVQRKHKEVVAYLLSKGANPNLATYNNHTTPLLSAAMFGSLDILKLLLEHGVKIDQKDKLGFNALHSAVENDRQEVVEYLIATKKLPLDEETVEGYTAIHLAVKKNHLEIFKVLCIAGARLNSSTSDSNSLLKIAFENQSEDILKYLLQNFPKKEGLKEIEVLLDKSFLTVRYLMSYAATMPIFLVNPTMTLLAKRQITSMELAYHSLYEANCIKDEKYAAEMIKVIRMYNSFTFEEEATQAIQKLEMACNKETIKKAIVSLENEEDRKNQNSNFSDDEELEEENFSKKELLVVEDDKDIIEQNSNENILSSDNSKKVASETPEISAVAKVLEKSNYAEQGPLEEQSTTVTSQEIVQPGNAKVSKDISQKVEKSNIQNRVNSLIKELQQKATSSKTLHDKPQTPVKRVTIPEAFTKDNNRPGLSLPTKAVAKLNIPILFSSVNEKKEEVKIKKKEQNKK